MERCERGDVGLFSREGGKGERLDTEKGRRDGKEAHDDDSVVA
jgi:hypothetical protein